MISFITPLGRFVLKTFLWLPISFGVWYFTSILVAVPLAETLDVLMRSLFPHLVQIVMPNGNGLLLILQSGDGETALALKLDPLSYGYCIPLYTALVLASLGEDGEWLWRWCIGMLILFLVQVFGLATESAKIMAFGLVETRDRLGLSAVGHEILAITYQLGFLILPSVAPLMLWGSQFRQHLPSLLSKESHP